MILEGDKGVIEAIKEKKRLKDSGEEHSHIKPLLIIDGGLMKGVYGVGASIAMDELGLYKNFIAIVGISSGAPTVAYTLAGSSHVGSSIMWDELCSKKFLSFLRWNNPLNSEFFKNILEGLTHKPLNFNKILNSKVPFYIGLSEYETAKPALLRPETKEELFMGIKASISMPGAVSDKIIIRDIRYVDGASTEPHILEHAYNRFEATHVLIITNQDKNTEDILWWDKLLTFTLFRFRMSSRLYSVALRRRKIRHEWVERILKDKVNSVCFVWGNGSIKSLERDSKIVQKTIESSYKWWREILS